jgi:hypothetical protein
MSEKKFPLVPAHGAPHALKFGTCETLMRTLHYLPL